MKENSFKICPEVVEALESPKGGINLYILFLTGIYVLVRQGRRCVVHLLFGH